MKREKDKKKPDAEVAGRRIVKRFSTEEEVSITLGIPKEVGRDRWECLLEIKGLEKAHRHRVTGGDSLQALLLAIEEARRKLEEDGDHFVWWTSLQSMDQVCDASYQLEWALGSTSV
jgi:hypothetical protein